MRTRLAKTIGLAVLCLLLALPTAAPAETFCTEIKTEADVVTADFATADPTGCIITGIAMFARRDVRLEPQPRVTTQELQLDIAQRDLCGGQNFVGRGTTTDFTLVVTNEGEGNLSTASVQASLTVRDFLTGATRAFTVALDWKGFGDIEKDVAVERDRSLPCIEVREDFEQRLRTASATGILSDGTANYAAGGSLFAEIRAVKQGTRACVDLSCVSSSPSWYYYEGEEKDKKPK